MDANNNPTDSSQAPIKASAKRSRVGDSEALQQQAQDDLDAAKLVGTKLAGKYLIKEVLGAGGMSVVYKAVQDSVDRVVALKTLKMELANDPVILQRFQREIHTLSRLNHPNIVTVYDCALSDQNQPFIVMDFVSGQSLADLLADAGRLTPERARRIFIQVCNALEHAHRHGVVHRDIKPGNIMLSGRTEGIDFVKVVDFGLAKLTEDQQKLTQTGHLWGSAPYMSPEQCEADINIPIDWRSDIYSFGAVMYETLTGADPFLGDTVLDTIWNHMNKDPVKFSQVDPMLRISPLVEGIVFKCLAKDRENRFQSMLELREALESAIPDTAAMNSSRVGMAAVSPASAAKIRASAKGKTTKSPFAASLKKKQANAGTGGIRNLMYGFLSGAVLVCVFFMFNNLLANQKANIDQIKKTVDAGGSEGSGNSNANKRNSRSATGGAGSRSATGGAGSRAAVRATGTRSSASSALSTGQVAATHSATPAVGTAGARASSDRVAPNAVAPRQHTSSQGQASGQGLQPHMQSHVAARVPQHSITHTHTSTKTTSAGKKPVASESRWSDLENLRSH